MGPAKSFVIFQAEHTVEVQRSGKHGVGGDGHGWESGVPTVTTHGVARGGWEVHVGTGIVQQRHPRGETARRRVLWCSYVRRHRPCIRTAVRGAGTAAPPVRA